MEIMKSNYLPNLWQLARNGACLLIFLITLVSCNLDEEAVTTDPRAALKQVDMLLAHLAGKPQMLSAPSDRITTATGSKGTVIHVDPSKLEMVDGTPLGGNIDIEVLELTNKSELLMQNAQTVSNGQLLVSGGAYYLNMTSGGKQLRIKQGQGIEVEFPKLTDSPMELFTGERDSSGQMNWTQTGQMLTDSNRDVLGIDSANAMLVFRESPKDTALIGDTSAFKTYEAVQLKNFGWINCDWFLNDPKPKTDIKLIVTNDSFPSGRFYAVFEDINSMMSAEYIKGQEYNARFFRNIPIGRNLKIIALSAKDSTSYMFEETIKALEKKVVRVDFKPVSRAELREKLTGMN